MAKGNTDEEFDGLDAFFTSARQAAPDPSVALLARIEADAQQVATERRRTAAPALAPRPGFWRSVADMLGGRGAVAGLLSAMLAAVWLGFSPPSGLASLTQSMLGSASSTTVDGLDLIPNIDSVLSQG